VCLSTTSAINTGTGRWTAKSNLDAVTTLKSSLLTLRALTTVAIHWVPGHSLIYGNEVADLLAKRGADGTTCSSMPDFPTGLIDLRLQCNLPPLD
jgi:ribonuclease HI